MPYHGFQTLPEEPLIKIEDNYVLKRGQILTEVNCSKTRFTTTRLGLKNHQTIPGQTIIKY